MAFASIAILAGLVFLILYGIGQGSSGSGSGAGSAPAPPIPKPPQSGGGNVQSGITNNPSTWPAGDSIWDLARAIAHAEGADVAGSVPDRFNNPGDISDGGNTFSQTYVSGSFVTMFPDKQTGWQWLYNKISNIMSGGSSVYNANMDFYDLGAEWTGSVANGNNWGDNVASYLGVSPTITLNAYFGV